jgi:hypothetical protein
LKRSWNQALEKDGYSPNFETRERKLGSEVSCYIDESEFVFGNKKYLALALVFTEDSNRIIASTIATLRAHHIEDPFYAGDKSALDQKGLHFADSHFDLRADYLKALAALPYRAFVIYGELSAGEDYAMKYYSMLSKTLRDRFVWYDGALLRFEVEQNSKVKIAAVESAIGAIYDDLKSSNGRRPFQRPVAKMNSKAAQPCFSVPDYLLGVFVRYAQFNEKKTEELRRVQFERVRDKIRLIVDFDSNREWSRRQPFLPWKLEAK